MDDLDVGRREDLTGEKRAEPVRLRRLTWAQTMKIETLKCASARFARRTSSQMMLQLVPELADGIRSGYYERAVKAVRRIAGVHAHVTDREAFEIVRTAVCLDWRAGSPPSGGTSPCPRVKVLSEPLRLVDLLWGSGALRRTLYVDGDPVGLLPPARAGSCRGTWYRPDPEGVEFLDTAEGCW